MRCRCTVNVSAVVRGCSYHIWALRHIRPWLDLNTAKTITQGIVAARLDYCNSLICIVSTRNLCRMEVTQNTLARAVCSVPWSTSATELHCSLHWLPDRQRIDYKTALIAFQARRTGRLAYITSLLRDYVLRRYLRSTDKLLLQSPFCRLSLGNSAFSISAPQVWNTLSLHCRASPSTDSFKCQLKAELFNTAYPVWSHLQRL